MNTTHTQCALNRQATHQQGRQGGVILFIALIALVALTMAGIGFMRSVDAGKILAGNLAFSRAAVAISDIGMEDSRGLLGALDAVGTANCGKIGVDVNFSCLWMNAPQILAAVPGLASSGINLNGLRSGGYFAWSDPSFDPLTHDWTNANISVCDPAICLAEQSGARTGYDVRYIIHRMCDIAYVSDAGPIGKPSISNCMTEAVLGGNSNEAGDRSKNTDMAGAGNPLYRVTIRVAGPRNTQSFVQVWMS